jgi:dihydrofolate reductase
MRKRTILTFVSLDGVMQSPKLPDEDLSSGFTGGGWANPCWENVMESVGEVAMSQPYDVLLGRTPYDRFAPGFPGSESLLNSATKYVVSSRPIDKAWKPTIKISGDVRLRLMR